MFAGLDRLETHEADLHGQDRTQYVHLETSADLIGRRQTSNGAYDWSMSVNANELKIGRRLVNHGLWNFVIGQSLIKCYAICS